MVRLPDESTVLRFRHLLEAHQLAARLPGVVNGLPRERGLLRKADTVVDATLPAPRFQRAERSRSSRRRDTN